MDSGVGLRQRKPHVGNDNAKHDANDVSGDASENSEPSTPPPSPPRQPRPPGEKPRSAVPLSMQVMRPFWLMSANCADCLVQTSDTDFYKEFFAGNVNLHHRHHRLKAAAAAAAQENGRENTADAAGEDAPPAIADDTSIQPQGDRLNNSTNDGHSPNALTPVPAAPIILPAAPLPATGAGEVGIERLLHEYKAACELYGCATRLNAGVLAALRYSLPTLRVSGAFHDADMLALAEVLLKHGNGALRHVTRLDFTVAGREGRDRGYYGGGGSNKKGLRSHGAHALSEALAANAHVREVYLSGNKIGPYGAAAVFAATMRGGGAVRTLRLRGCRIGERGARSFVEEMRRAGDGLGLTEVDLSANRMGCAGCYAIDDALKARSMILGERNDNGGETKGEEVMQVDLEGNMVFQEVMNCVTHGLGVLLSLKGTSLLMEKVRGLPYHYWLSCRIYCASIMVLYTSSTLYHSFFALKKTKYIFQVFDKCAIYLLIAGSYTPFFMIALHHEPAWQRLLWFIWTCAISGILVEMFLPLWKDKKIFSLVMYLGMGWSCLVCVPDLVEVLSLRAMGLIVAGGVAYTGGVPFFVRNNNLDHSIWHMFVLAGSVFHWLCVFWYVAVPRVDPY